MNKLAIGVACLILVAGVVAVSLYTHSPGSKQTAQAEIDFKHAQQLLSSGQAREALEIINRYQSSFSAQSKPQDWLTLAVEALGDSPDNANALFVLYEKFPKAVAKNEPASLLVASTLLSQNKLAEYRTLRGQWQSSSSRPEAWYVLDADALLMQGKTVEALAHLNAKTFEGPGDALRLMRLAMISSKNNIESSWNYLRQAQEKDPQNPQVLLLKAKILENINQYPKAHKEYLAAYKLTPGNTALIEELGEFYRRHDQIATALQAWQWGLELPNSENLWVKVLFWSKVATPVKSASLPHMDPKGPLKPFLQYLAALGPDEFWNAAAFDSLTNKAEILNSYQETFWLRVLDALKNNRDEDAALYLVNNPFRTVNWAPELSTALRQIISYRQTGVWPSSAEPLINTSQAEIPVFIEELEAINRQGGNMPDALKPLLASQEAYSALFLAQGWLKAGLKLNKLEAVPSNFPDWISYSLAQAIQQVEGNEKALEYALGQKETPALILLIAELEMAQGHVGKGVAYLDRLASDDSEYGYRAAWMLSVLQMEQEQYDDARQTILGQPRLAGNVLGKEALAKIALKKGDVIVAENIYEEIQDESDEAKFYLERKAIADQDWAKAEKLILELMEDYPDHEQLKADREKIKAKIKDE